MITKGIELGIGICLAFAGVWIGGWLIVLCLFACDKEGK